MITADDIADLARKLVGDTATEVRIRCGVSRAYYAAFHYCETAANSFCSALSDADREDRGNHAQLYYRLENLSNDDAIANNLKLMAAEAKKLRTLRVRSDYHLNDTVDKRTFERGLHHMSEVKSYLESLNTSAQTQSSTNAPTSI